MQRTFLCFLQKTKTTEHVRILIDESVSSGDTKPHPVGKNTYANNDLTACKKSIFLGGDGFEDLAVPCTACNLKIDAQFWRFLPVLVRAGYQNDIM